MGVNAQAMHDELLANQVDGARHDADLCPFCTGGDTASDDGTRASVPSGDQPSGAPADTDDHPTSEGGTQDMSDDKTISMETHEALMAKAVSDAVSTTEKALENKTTEAADLAKRVDELTTELSSVKDDNARLNGELDTAQVNLKAAQDEVASLKESAETEAEQARLAKVKDERAEQVKALGIFPEDYVTEKAEAWAALADDAWTEKVDEWAKARPTTSEKSTDSASAMTGASGDLTTDKASSDATDTKPSARRGVLGLPA